MSTADVFISSSPPRASGIDSYPAALSSPDLPPLTEIFAKNPKKPALRSRNNGAAIPANAIPAFTSAASLLRDAPEIDIDTERIIKSPPPLKPKTVNGLIRRVGADVQAQTGAQKEPPILIDSSPKEKPWQKFKSRTPTPEKKQPPIPEGRVAKSTVEVKPRKKANQSRAKTETVSKHFTPKTREDQLRSKESEEKRVENGGPSHSFNGKEALAPNTSNYTSCLEPALRRRVDWTPPPADNAILIASDSDHQELLSSAAEAGPSKEVFQKLFDNYACKDNAGSIPSGQPQEQQVEVLKKRKRIELVTTTIEQPKQAEPGREASPSKPVATKKKTRTITEIATAPYAQALPEPEFDLSKRSTRDSLLEYFDSGSEVKALVEYQSIVMSKNKETAKPAKAKAKPRKKKAGAAEAPILLSPNSALKQSSNQDFVFGTSSQLLGDESPTTLKQLHLAIQASNRDDDPFGESDTQGLWRAGARDHDGDLMEVDVVDLVRTPVMPGKHQGAAEKPHLPDQPPSDDFVDIDTIAFDTPGAQKPVPSQHNSYFFQTQQTPTPPLSNPDNGFTTSAAASGTSAPQPNYETFTDLQLSKQVASYGFKPVKKRQAMIALLDQCWASKNPGITSAPSQSMSTTAVSLSPKRKGKAAVPSPPATDSATEKPAKKPRGRPRKTSETPAATSSKSASAAASNSKKESSPKKPRRKTTKQPARKVEVIADSENSDLEDEDRALSPSLSPSPPPPDSGLSATLAADEAAADEATLAAPAASAKSEAAQANLFRHITRAVTTAPRSRDPADPSWHEKMLLYDPIVLEDLAAWLNAGELTRVGYDGEVTPGDVKRWCEARSVVCLWRQNSKGKARKRL